LHQPNGGFAPCRSLFLRVCIFSYHLRGKIKLLWAIAAARDPQSERLHPVAELDGGARRRIEMQPDECPRPWPRTWGSVEHRRSKTSQISFRRRAWPHRVQVCRQHPDPSYQAPLASVCSTSRPPQPCRIAHSRTLRCSPTTCHTHEPAGPLMPPRPRAQTSSVASFKTSGPRSHRGRFLVHFDGRPTARSESQRSSSSSALASFRSAVSKPSVNQP
jgi:hypothetical protein